MHKVIGRQSEIQTLDSIWKSKEAELVTLYGRRRVGKTHLIREILGRRGIFFETTGMKNAPLGQQLKNFTNSLSETFAHGLPLRVASNWLEAFQLLTGEIRKLPKSKKITVFFDELPWMATRRSNLLQALDYQWNTQWSRMANVKIVLCGSAASWILDNLINAKGGLHNRLTRIIALAPFCLNETKSFLRQTGVRMSDKQILDIFLVTGGVPYYLKQIQKSRSAILNIDAICFRPDGILRNEFPRIFKALFDQAETNLKIIREIANHRYGLPRKKLLATLRIKSGGSFNKRIGELEAAGFIQSFQPFQKQTRDTYFRVVDEYSLFYLRWIETEERSGFAFPKGHWQKVARSPAWLSWAGYAFEGVCLKHIDQIREAIGIRDTRSHPATWRHIEKRGNHDGGAQIDLLFDRDDDTITLCEIKYSSSQITIYKSFAKSLMNKIHVFEKQTQTKKQLSIATITTAGVKPNQWSNELVDHQVTLSDLFQP